MLAFGLPPREYKYCTSRIAYRAAVFHDAVGEAAVALGSDLHIIGALQQDGLLQVAC